jgi:hypothetical protein
MDSEENNKKQEACITHKLFFWGLDIDSCLYKKIRYSFLLYMTAVFVDGQSCKISVYTY